MKIYEGKGLKKNCDIYIFLMEGQKFLENFKVEEGEEIQKAIENSDFKGKEGEFKVVHTGKFQANIFLIGLGREEKLTLENFRTTISNYLLKAGPVFYLFLNPKFLRVDEKKSFSVAIFNISILDYKFQEFLKEKSKEKEVYLFKPLDTGEKSFKEILKYSGALKEGVFLARDIGNYPASSLSTNTIIEKIKKIGKEFNWRINVFNEKKLKSLKLPGIVNVGKASENPPILIEINSSEKTEKVLIGKGVIFDSGGLSIKTAEGMENMKYDKCGAGVALGTLYTLSILKKNKGLTVYLPLVENLISHRSFKPGDILVYPNGESVEVLSTDAEGRLILADCLLLASRKKPSFIVSIATLTGAMKFSLGPYAAGLFTKNRELEEALMESSKRTGEFIWPFPLWEEYETLIKGEHSTIKNTSSGIAGSITGALFLNHFTDLPFAHIDIAMMAYKTEKKQKGATGFGVQLLTDFILNENY